MQLTPKRPALGAPPNTAMIASRVSAWEWMVGLVESTSGVNSREVADPVAPNVNSSGWMVGLVGLASSVNSWERYAR